MKNYVHICWKTNSLTVIDSFFPFPLLPTHAILSFSGSAALSVGPWVGFDTLVSVSESPRLCCISISDVDEGAEGAPGGFGHRPGRSGWCARGMCCCPEGPDQAGQLNKEEHKILSLGLGLGEEQAQDTLGDTQQGTRKGSGEPGEHQEGELCLGPCWEHCHQVQEGIPPCSSLWSSSLDCCVQFGLPSVRETGTYWKEPNMRKHFFFWF